MTASPLSPRLLKGALVGVDLLNPIASVVVFQYNPDGMTRRLEPRGAGEGEKGEAFRLSGPPQESITLTTEIDAADQLAEANPVALASGVSPTLAALEMMLYPKSALVLVNTILAAIGTIEIVPAEGPMILFVWGPSRVLPVRLTGLTITEEAYDPQLNPIRAKAEIALSVLSYNDLKLASPGHALFFAHQVAKEALATANLFAGADQLGAALRF